MPGSASATKGVQTNWNVPTSVPAAAALPGEAPTGVIVMAEDTGLTWQWDGTQWNLFPASTAPDFPALVEGPNADTTFNGDGSGGATQLFAVTTIQQDAFAGVVTWNFESAGASPGWVVLFRVVGSSGGTLALQTNGVDITFFDNTVPAAPFALIYDGTEWRVETIDITIT